MYQNHINTIMTHIVFMKHNEVILQPQQYRLIWRISFLIFGSIGLELYLQLYRLVIVSVIILCTSLLYWHKPDYGIRRTVDMVAVRLGLLYNLAHGYGTSGFSAYCVIVVVGICVYFFGVYCYKRGLHWESVYIHCFCYVLWNISNVVLFLGYMPKALN